MNLAGSVVICVRQGDLSCGEGNAAGLRSRRVAPAVEAREPGEDEERAGLVAAGRSNRQISDELFLSERTVETHVTHILAKLGVATRVEVAVWRSARDARPSEYG